MSKSFWDFEPYVKWDVLDEVAHERLVHGALADRTTNIERVDSDTVILYGEDEGLLFRPISPLIKVAVYLYEGLCTILHL